MVSRRVIYLLFSALLCGGSLYAQDKLHVADSLAAKGDSLRCAYCFEESLVLYQEALSAVQDPVMTAEDTLAIVSISDRILLSENGKNMSEYVYSPKVVARHVFSQEDFFLYYPLKDSCWRAVPNVLDSMPSPHAKAIYAPSDEETIYFSGQDKDGIRNIYFTRKTDSLWTLPALLNEHLVSASDEIYPMLSEDGKSLYFASAGLYGVGGYDLYVSHWDEREKDWSEPVNMGFPYSSPANDYLLCASEDGHYTVFASDRDCQGDSVTVYVLEHDSMPLRSSVTDPAQLRNLSRLEPAAASEPMDKDEVKSDIPEDADTRRYMDKMAQIRELKDTVALFESSLEQLRDRYSLEEDPVQKESLVQQILSAEAQIPALQSRLETATKQLQDIEMDFLFSGIVIDPDKLLVEAEREIVGETIDYAFTRMVMGEPLNMEVQQPEPEVDYTFRILEDAQIIRDTVSHSGPVYQIQIMSSDRPAPLKSLKGLCPVFETVTTGGKYIYRVGLFFEYQDVLQHLNAVKRLGFRTAYIVAFYDGEEKTVAQVRNMENENKLK